MPLFHRDHSRSWDDFAELFEGYKNLVYKTAYLMLGDPVEAEEALQEVFVLVYRSQSSYNPDKGAISTWLHRITINYCLGFLRKGRLLSQPLEEDHLENDAPSQDANLEYLDVRREVIRAINQLTEKQRVVVILRYYWDLPYAEIAQILEIPLGTVKSRIDLALRTLRVNLASWDEESVRVHH